MKTCDLIRCKRLALGMTQQELAAEVGVSSSTIANFESGKEVSVVVFNGVKNGIDKVVSELNKTDYLKYSITYKAYKLDLESDAEKIKTLQYMLLDIAKLNLELSKNIGE